MDRQTGIRTDGHTDGLTDISIYRVASQLKIYTRMLNQKGIILVDFVNNDSLSVTLWGHQFYAFKTRLNGKEGKIQCIIL